MRITRFRLDDRCAVRLPGPGDLPRWQCCEGAERRGAAMVRACSHARRLARRQGPLSRRSLLQVGATGALGLTLADALRLEAAGAAPATDRACIVLWLTGGPSQLDTFDLKPDAPAEIRGPFRPIETSVSGIRIGETFPLLARQAHRFALLRSVYHSLDDHARGMCWMLAGRLHDSLKYPTMGSVIARLRPPQGQMPPFVTVPRLNLIAGIAEVDHSQTAGDLGAAWDPVVPDGVPGAPGFGVRDLDVPGGLPAARFERRARLLADVSPHPAAEPPRSPGRELDALQARALALVRSDQVRQAFDLEPEPAALRDRYGRHGFGQSALLARRLVERGVRFVTVNWPTYYSWDHHGTIEGGIKKLGPVADHALATLLADLADRGMLERTLVLCMGEFGRTPKLNATAGRDHWIHVMSVLMAGGGIRGGQVVGSSDAQGAYPDERPVHAREMVATAYRALGIDLHAELPTVLGRPIQVLPGAEPVRELF